MVNNVIVQPPRKPIVIGKIGKAYGVWGWIRVISFTDKIDNIFFYTPWFILFGKQWKIVRLSSWKLIGNRYIIRIIDVKSRESAMLLNQKKLIIDSNQLPKLCDNEYYWNDIIGCVVITTLGVFVGIVIYIIDTVAHDILVIKVHKNNFIKSEDYFVPFVQDKIIKDVNLSKNIITVDWNFNIV